MVDVTVVPAQAGTHNHRLWNMGSRFRGNDGNKRRRSQSGGSRNNCAAVHKTSEQRMYNLHLSPEQLQIRDTVRDFVAEVIKPLALKPERLEARARPLLVEALDKASEMGLRALALSEDRGGAGADNLTCCIVTEELAVGDPDVATVLAQTAMLGRVFERLMTPAQRDRFLPQFVGDDRFQL